MKDYYKIGEISEMYDMSRDSLIYYEKIGIIKPTRDNNGYRLYSISDIWRLNLIKELKSLGFSFKMIKEYLENRDLDSTNKLLEDGITLLDDQILRLLKQKENMRKRMESIDKTASSPNLNSIELTYLKERKGLILNGEVKRDEDFDLLIQKLQKNYNNKFNILGNNNLGSVFKMNSLEKGITTDYESVFCLLKDNETEYNIIFEEGYYVTLIYSGDYTNNKEHIKNMFDFIEENKLIVAGNPMEIYRIDIHETENKNEFITEIQIPIKC
ncbi:MerR family transcriptional regulator [Terrisporobacter sp.]